MALSPGVSTQERDLTFAIQSVTSNASAYVGLFKWGPAEELIEITTNESELVTKLGRPDTVVNGFFLAAANYLLYSNPLYIARAVGAGALNAQASDATPANVLIKNDDVYGAADLTGVSFVGRYAGELGNSIKISIANSVDYDNWAYASNFDFAPGSATEFNVVVIDEDGLFSGTAGSVLETFELVNNTPGSKKLDGTTAYIKEVLSNQSNYILLGDFDEVTFTSGVYEISLVGGVDDNVVANADFNTAWDVFANKETVEMTRVFTSFNPSTAVGYAIDAMESRQDAIAFNSCELADVYNTTSQVANVKDYFGTTINKNTSYAFNVDNWKLVYDKYNDINVWIPVDSDVAGLHARVFTDNEPWFSPAGLNRGQLKNVIKLAWSATKPQRDVLYPAHINSVISLVGEGNVLWGDKTALQAPSAFNRINVRSLFIVIKKAIAQAARYQLFELNDFITQSIFRTATDRYLADVQARRGITDRLVVCDSTNNTAQVIAANEFVGEIIVDPARSINNIRLIFTAVNGDVNFQELQG